MKTGESVSFEDVQGFYRGRCYWERPSESAAALIGLYRDTLRPFVLAEGSNEKQIMNVIKSGDRTKFYFNSEKEAKRFTYMESSYPLSDDLDNPFKTLSYDLDYNSVGFIRKKERGLVFIMVSPFSPETPYEDYVISFACHYPVKL